MMSLVCLEELWNGQTTVTRARRLQAILLMPAGAPVPFFCVHAGQFAPVKQRLLKGGPQ
jgi:hypothetical protein